MKKLFGVMLLLAASTHMWGQKSAAAPAAPPAAPCNNTFVKQMDGIGTIEPRVFRDPATQRYFLTARDNNATYISGVTAAGTVTWSQKISFTGDIGTITDM